MSSNLQYLDNQYQEIVKHDYYATWLLQYDVLGDDELINKIEKFNSNQEIGIFLEVSPDLAKKARVIYPHVVSWSDPSAVFLSGYTQSERRKIIDVVFTKFRSVFNYYPKSIGAWWIDSYSLSYIENKYNIDTVLIVADQKMTDNYGIWGQWWGVPYIPEKQNILVPANSIEQSAGYVVVQWAQRDLTRAYGSGTSYSNYSLQANDYIERGLKTDYFVNLTSKYLDCSLSIGQITVGLETGMESASSFPEYVKQLNSLSKMKNLHSVTMSDFAKKYSEIYSLNPTQLILKDNQSGWELDINFRRNALLSDSISYQHGFSFSDYYVLDKNGFLDRSLPINKNFVSGMRYPIFGVLAFIIGLFIFYKKKILVYFLPVSLFVFSFLLPLLRSYIENGWQVFFGPVVENISLYQFCIPLIFFLLFSLSIAVFKKDSKLNLIILMLPLSFSLDFLIFILRYTRINGVIYFGVMIDVLKFVGLSISNNIRFVLLEFSPVVASSLLKFKPEYIWGSNFRSFVVYPVSHIIITYICYVCLLRFPKWLIEFIIILMTIFYICYIVWIFRLDPRIVV